MWEEEYYIFDSNTISESDFEEKLEYQDYKAFEDSMMGDEVVNRLNELAEENKELKYKYDEQSNEKMGLEESIEELLKENKELKKQIEDLYENDKSLRKMMSGMSLNYQGITVHRSLYSEVLKILKENGAEDLYADLEKTSIDTLINGC